MKSKTVFSGHQPNFLPYMGVFYKVFRSDVFVLDDDVQYSRTGLHNSNYIRVGNQKFQITVPVSYSYGDPINEVRINYEKPWVDKMMKTVRNNYKNARYFDEVYSLFDSEIRAGYEKLVDLNIALFLELCARFGFSSKIVIASRDVPTQLRKNERNVYQCERLGGTVYYSGTGGREYNDEALYREKGIEVVYSDYEPVKYRQCWKPDFIENLSVLDYIFNQGFQIPGEWVKKQ